MVPRSIFELESQYNIKLIELEPAVSNKFLELSEIPG